MPAEDHEKAGDATIQVVLGQYTAYLTDLGNIGTSYTTANAFYTSILSVLLAILALANKGAALAQFNILLFIVVPLFAGFLCLNWWETMNSYGASFKAHFDVLREMEAQLPFKTFTREQQVR